MTLYYGADYYPEQETPEQIRQDAETMAQAGFNAVRVGEFAWCKFEPSDGVFDWAWFDQALATLDAKGVHALVCTPTACPPIWMVEAHPEIAYVDNCGVARPFGARRHYCPNNATYIKYCVRVAAEMGKRYGRDPRVLGFHIDNELAQEATGRCQCAGCKKQFHAWLEKKYGTIAKLNEIYGTIFWGQTYTRFDQINLPAKSIEPGGTDLIDCYFDNPTLRLDWERFCSDGWVAFYEAQVRAIKPHTDKPVTTNTTGVWTNGMDYYKAAPSMDVAAVDEYVGLRSETMPGFGYAFMRGLKPGKPFWIVETSSGGGLGVWAREGVYQPYPGALRQSALHAFASGAEMHLYFQFRMFRFGAEQLEASVMGIDGIPDRRFKEFQEVSATARAWTPFLSASRLKSNVAVCFDYDTLWSSKIKPFCKYFNYQ